MSWSPERVLREYGEELAGKPRCRTLASPVERDAPRVSQQLRVYCWFLVVTTPGYVQAAHLLKRWYKNAQGIEKEEDLQRVFAFQEALRLQIKKKGFNPDALLEDDPIPRDWDLIDAKDAAELLGIGVKAVSNDADRGNIDRFERRGRRLKVCIGYVRDKLQTRRKKEFLKNKKIA